jgi:hypothetical protein
MSMAGRSKSRLARMHQVLSGHVKRKDIPGLVTLSAIRTTFMWKPSAPWRSAIRLQ